MPIQLLLPLAMMVLFGGYTLWSWKKRTASQAPAFRVFFERTGYRYAELPQGGLEEQIAHGMMLAKRLTADMRGGGTETHMIRDFHGLPIHWVSWMKTNKDGGWSMGCTWYATLSAPPRSKVQIAEKSLSGVGKAVKEMFSNSERVWSAVYTQKVPTGDADLDGRFHVYADDPGAPARVLAAPGLRELLLGPPPTTAAGSPVRTADTPTSCPPISSGARSSSSAGSRQRPAGSRSCTGSSRR